MDFCQIPFLGLAAQHCLSHSLTLMQDILVWKVLCALIRNLHSLPFLPSGVQIAKQSRHTTFHTRISWTSTTFLSSLASINLLKPCHLQPPGSGWTTSSTRRGWLCGRGSSRAALPRCTTTTQRPLPTPRRTEEVLRVRAAKKQSFNLNLQCEECERNQSAWLVKYAVMFFVPFARGLKTSFSFRFLIDGSSFNLLTTNRFLQKFSKNPHKSPKK